MSWHYLHRYAPIVLGVLDGLLFVGFLAKGMTLGAVIFGAVCAAQALWALWRWDTVDCGVCWKQDFFKSLPSSARQGKTWRDVRL